MHLTHVIHRFSLSGARVVKERECVFQKRAEAIQEWQNDNIPFGRWRPLKLSSSQHITSHPPPFISELYPCEVSNIIAKEHRSQDLHSFLAISIAGVELRGFLPYQSSKPYQGSKERRGRSDVDIQPEMPQYLRCRSTYNAETSACSSQAKFYSVFLIQLSLFPSCCMSLAGSKADFRWYRRIISTIVPSH